MIEAAIGIGAGTYNIGVPPMVHLTGVPVTLTQFEDHVVEDKIGTITNRTAVWSENDVPKYMVIYPYTLAVNKYGDRFATEESIGFLDSWKAGPTYYSLWSADQIEDLKVNGFDTAALTGPSVAWLGYRDAVPADHITTRDHLMALAMPDRYVTCMPDHTPITMIDEILQAGIDAGFIYKADTLEELAEVLGMGRQQPGGDRGKLQRRLRCGRGRSLRQAGKIPARPGRRPLLRRHRLCAQLQHHRRAGREHQLPGASSGRRHSPSTACTPWARTARVCSIPKRRPM